MVDRGVSMDDFTLLSVIGRGTYGKVLLVRKNTSGELLAMKMLRKKYLSKRNQVEHTKTERSVLEKVQHPFIVKLKYAFQNAKKLYFVLEYCPGGELFFHLSRAHKFTEERAKFYAACIILALEKLHSENIIYRDLKPENVLIDSQGFAKLTDFGLSKENILNSTGANSFCGTPEYLAPEIIRKRGHGKAVDWWALGALIFEMLTGLPPFYTSDRQKLFENILENNPNFPSFISEEAKCLIEGLLEKDEERRLGEGIKNYSWFKDINWEKLLRKEVTPPFLPNCNQEGLPNFEDEFKRIPAVDSAGAEINFSAQSPTYQGFTYVNSLEDSLQAV